MTLARLGAAAAMACAAWRGVAAQNSTPRYAEYRGDVVISRGTAVQAGVGEVVPLGVYVRLGFDAAAGATWRDGSAHASGRADAIARFLLDPFREIPIAVSVGGGLSVPYAQGDTKTRPYLTAVIDVEGRKHGALTPAVQIGLGGGVRVGLVFRASPNTRR